MGRGDTCTPPDGPRWEWLDRPLRRWWRIAGPPPELTEADIVPAGALPLCPACVLPHDPLVARCPECGEIVTPWATSMAFVWIFVWGPKLQRVMSQARLSRLLCAGLLISGAGMVAAVAAMSWAEASSIVEQPEPLVSWVAICLTVLIAGIANLAAGLRMIETAVRRWGSWREHEAGGVE